MGGGGWTWRAVPRLLWEMVISGETNESLFENKNRTQFRKVKVKATQSCPTPCDPMDYTVRRILQARILEWVTVPFSRDLPNPGTEPRSPALQADSLPAEPHGKPSANRCIKRKISKERDRGRQRDKERKAGKRDLLTHVTAKSRGSGCYRSRDSNSDTRTWSLFTSLPFSSLHWLLSASLLWNGPHGMQITRISSSPFSQQT